MLLRNNLRIKFFSKLLEEFAKQEVLEIDENVLVPSSLIVGLGYDYLTLKVGGYYYKLDEKGRKYIDIALEDLE